MPKKGNPPRLRKPHNMSRQPLGSPYARPVTSQPMNARSTPRRFGVVHAAAPSAERGPSTICSNSLQRSSSGELPAPGQLLELRRATQAETPEGDTGRCVRPTCKASPSASPQADPKSHQPQASSQGPNQGAKYTGFSPLQASNAPATATQISWP